MANGVIIPNKMTYETTPLKYFNSVTWTKTGDVYYAVFFTYDKEITSVSLRGFGALPEVVVPYISGDYTKVGLLAKNDLSSYSNAYVGFKVVFAY